MKDYHINIFYSEEDDGYIADIPDLVACSAFGATPEEALREVEVARAAWIEAAEPGDLPSQNHSGSAGRAKPLDASLGVQTPTNP